LRLGYPLINASGTMELFDLAATVDGRFLAEPPVAAYVPKTITLSPRVGNPPPRILETPSGTVWIPSSPKSCRVYWLCRVL
jgi:dihydroorotate dehydrogenase